MDINGALPSKKALPQPKSIQEFFNNKKKAQTTDSIIQIEEVGNMPNTSVTNSPLSQGTSPVEEVESILLPLSPEIRLVPNLPCRNRFGPLAEEGYLTRDHENSKAELDIEDVNSLPIPIPTIFSEPPASEVNLSSILQRIDEVRNLVLQLAKFLQGKMVNPSSCKCQMVEVAGKGGTLAVGPTPPTPTAHGGPAIHSQSNGIYISDTEVIQTSLANNSTNKRSGINNIPVDRAPTVTCTDNLGSPLVSLSSQTPGRCITIANTLDKGDCTSLNVSRPFVPPPTCDPDHATTLYRVYIDPAISTKSLGSKSRNNTLFLTNVPKLLSGSVENHDSRINKVTHWLRFRRNCLSVIRTDISKVKRWSPLGSNYDVISVEFLDKTLVDQLIAFDERTFKQRGQKGGGISLVSELDDASLAPVYGQLGYINRRDPLIPAESMQSKSV
ncbi:hypothetical protein NDU88_002672 [Pleurodeles waltl]|uniref:Uncharacterized protein n=1 Tax=Pleurodeles waltl TaxID=8319 RepID=A0AAV7KUV2_PLEWA|nr:hypothetical protein NDU88_002672 [Pleurodeles waltl]